MVSFADRFKSLKEQALQAVDTFKEDEKVQNAWAQARQKLDVASKKVDELAASEFLTNALEKGEKAVVEARQQFKQSMAESREQIKQSMAEAQQSYRNSVDKSCLVKAEQDIENHRYTKGISLLENSIQPDSVVYEEAQGKIAHYQQLYAERQAFIESQKHLFPVEIEDRLVAGVEINDILHIVLETKRTESIYTPIQTTYADGVFIILCFNVHNDGKKARSVSLSMMNLIDSEGREFNSSSDAQLALLTKGDQTAEMLMSEIQPGVTKTVTVVFDISKSSTDLKLRIPCGLFGGFAYLPFELL
ncbi:DUF4352 domain-containing protein [Pseudanabaena sp. FACHB-2040]|uniref:DUF4352 domain-containing protein n=1 Tax=Pseudanabaena sp. FACHB-2040 TaxID=2692859 RepID=UPI001688FB8E|nr:DUF4352 domain-containing protein [Pseudanabaena sp. FACHB-2040]MBD2261082.1 DUF4352 domain-containing protein [Pseudanabaena sp. FACHB-2040]